MTRVRLVQKLSRLITGNIIPVVAIFIFVVLFPLSGLPASYLVQELLMCIARNSFLILSLLIPIMTGMGLNFGITLGVMAGQIGLIFITDWGIIGISGILLAMIIGTPIAAALGMLCGSVLNRAKGHEMLASYVLVFFANSIYQLVVLYFMGSVIPLTDPTLVLSRGYGIKNTIDLFGIRSAIDGMIPVKIWNFNVPVATCLIIAFLCLLIVWFRRTKLGQDMNAIGQEMAIAESAGIPVNRTRVIAIVISTVLACYGQIIHLQSIGTISTSSHVLLGMSSITALLIGGASVSRAGIGNVFWGAAVFHLMFIVYPTVCKNLFGDAIIGDYFRNYITYTIILIALVMHAREKAIRNPELKDKR